MPRERPAQPAKRLLPERLIAVQARSYRLAVEAACPAITIYPVAAGERLATAVQSIAASLLGSGYGAAISESQITVTLPEYLLPE